MVLGIALVIGLPDRWNDPAVAPFLGGYGLLVYVSRARGPVLRWLVPIVVAGSADEAAELTGWSPKAHSALQTAAMGVALACVFVRWVT